MTAKPGKKNAATLTAEVVQNYGSTAAMIRREEDMLAKIEDDLLAENVRIVRAVAAFRDVDPLDVSGTVPDDFIERAGGDVKEAEKDYRVARAAWLGAKDAPVGILHSYRIVQGIMKLKAEEKAAQRQTAQARPLNILVMMGAPVPKGESDIATVPALEVEK